MYVSNRLVKAIDGTENHLKVKTVIGILAL
jgi:hypothetical protein